MTLVHHILMPHKYLLYDCIVLYLSFQNRFHYRNEWEWGFSLGRPGLGRRSWSWPWTAVSSIRNGSVRYVVRIFGMRFDLVWTCYGFQSRTFIGTVHVGCSSFSTTQISGIWYENPFGYVFWYGFRKFLKKLWFWIDSDVLSIFKIRKKFRTGPFHIVSVWSRPEFGPEPKNLGPIQNRKKFYFSKNC